MRSRFCLFRILLLLAAFASTTPGSAQGAAVTDQRVLADGGASAKSRYDLAFALFNAESGVGLDDNSICRAEADGAAPAAVQGLNWKLEQKETEIVGLKARLEALEEMIHHQKFN